MVKFSFWPPARPPRYPHGPPAHRSPSDGTHRGRPALHLRTAPLPPPLRLLLPAQGRVRGESQRQCSLSLGGGTSPPCSHHLPPEPPAAPLPSPPEHLAPGGPCMWFAPVLVSTLRGRAPSSRRLLAPVCGRRSARLLPAQDRTQASGAHGPWKQLLSGFRESEALDLHIITQ